MKVAMVAVMMVAALAAANADANGKHKGGGNSARPVQSTQTAQPPRPVSTNPMKVRHCARKAEKGKTGRGC